MTHKLLVLDVMVSICYKSRGRKVINDYFMEEKRSSYCIVRKNQTYFCTPIKKSFWLLKKSQETALKENFTLEESIDCHKFGRLHSNCFVLCSWTQHLCMSSTILVTARHSNGKESLKKFLANNMLSACHLSNCFLSALSILNSNQQLSELL